jgi:hypothetical protein
MTDILLRSEVKLKVSNICIFWSYLFTDTFKQLFSLFINSYPMDFAARIKAS